MLSVWSHWWQEVGGPQDKIWDLVALVWPIRSLVITTSSALVKCSNFFGCSSVGFRGRDLCQGRSPWITFLPRSSRHSFTSLSCQGRSPWITVLPWSSRHSFTSLCCQGRSTWITVLLWSSRHSFTSLSCQWRSTWITVLPRSSRHSFTSLFCQGVHGSLFCHGAPDTFCIYHLEKKYDKGHLHYNIYMFYTQHQAIQKDFFVTCIYHGSHIPWKVLDNCLDIVLKSAWLFNLPWK